MRWTGEDGISRHACRALAPLLEFCRALPPPVVVPVAILLFGYGQNLKLFVIAMLTLVPGIGSLIVRAQREYQSAQVYGLLVLVGALGFLLNNGFALLEGFILRHWPPRANDSM